MGQLSKQDRGSTWVHGLVSCQGTYCGQTLFFLLFFQLDSFCPFLAKESGLGHLGIFFFNGYAPLNRPQSPSF